MIADAIKKTLSSQSSNWRIITKNRSWSGFFSSELLLRGLLGGSGGLLYPYFLFLLRGGLAFGSPCLELLNPSGGVYELLLAGIERVALGADFNLHLFFGGAGLYGIAADAGNNRVWVVFGVDFRFHTRASLAAFMSVDKPYPDH